MDHSVPLLAVTLKSPPTRFLGPCFLGNMCGRSGMKRVSYKCGVSEAVRGVILERSGRSIPRECGLRETQTGGCRGRMR